MIRAAKVTLDKDRNFVFDLNTMARYEDVTGKSSFKIAEELSASSIRALLWAGLVHEDEALTLQDVGSLITPFNMESISNAINSAIGRASPPEDAEKSPKN